jgi:hypothetical protein
MSARAVVSGAVFRAPTQKTTKTGAPFAFATIRSGTGETVRWWKVIAFSESGVAEIMQLGAGQPIAVAGERRSMRPTARRLAFPGRSWPTL